MQEKTIEFTSTMFKPVPGEEDKTNPGIFGQALAEWIASELATRGTQPEEVLAEDWGWLVIVHRKPVLLWVGCGNVDGEENRWRCLVVAEQGILARFFRRTDTSPYIEDLYQLVLDVLKAEKKISDIIEAN